MSLFNKKEIEDSTPKLEIVTANQYNGEKVIRLYHKDYRMKIDMGVIAEFQSETGHDYMRVAIRAMNALRKTITLDTMDQAELMTSAVTMEDAAWLFYLAAKKMDSTVMFDEIQEAVLFEGPLNRLVVENSDEPVVRDSYPVLFTNLVMFATLGVVDTAKKHS